MSHIELTRFSVTNNFEEGTRIVRVSSLADFRTSPKHWMHAQITPKTETKMMKLGTMLHMVLLEPQSFDQKYYVAESLDDIPETIEEIRAWVRAKGGEPRGSRKEDVIASAREIDPLFNTRSGVLAARCAGREIVSPEDWTLMEESVKSVGAHDMARELLLNPEHERVIEERMWAQFGGTNLVITGQPDCVIPKMSLCVEIKRSFASSPEAFERQAFAMGYHVQAAAYTELLAKRYGRPFGFVWIVVEADAPHSVGVYAPDDAMLEAGRLELKGIMSKLNECFSTNSWPGPAGNDVKMISLKSWQLQASLNAGPAEEFGL